MLITIAGSQSSGKTSLLKELQARGYNVIQQQTARSILTEWNMQLQEINQDPELTIKFQSEIIRRKFCFETSDSYSSDLWFVERSFMDSASYLIASVGKLNKYHATINQYYEQCVQYQQIYDHVFYLKGGIFSIEDDGVRNINQHYAQMIDLFMEQHTKVCSKNIDIIDFDGIDRRVDFVLDKLRLH